LKIPRSREPERLRFREQWVDTIPIYVLTANHQLPHTRLLSITHPAPSSVPEISLPLADSERSGGGLCMRAWLILGG